MIYDAHAHWPRKIRPNDQHLYKIIQNWDYWKFPKQYPENPFSAGLHPWYLDEFETPKEVISFLDQHAAHPNCVAIGECGLDYFKLNHSQEQQMMVFETILKWRKINKPLVIHSVKSETAILKILKEQNYQGPLVWHNYLLKEFPKTPFPLFASLSFRFFQMPEENKRKILGSIPINRLLIESDELEDAPLGDYLSELKLSQEQLAENFKLAFGQF
jgi:TatD DNase family protein